jgi:acyl carrier protein
LSRFSAPFTWQVQFQAPCPQQDWKNIAMDRAEVDSKIRTLIEPFNKKGVELKDDTTFVNDLEFDSLTVMDFVAEIEDEFDIIISMNQQAEIENYGQLVDAVTKLQD